jgi:hypothetical protein
MTETFEKLGWPAPDQWDEPYTSHANTKLSEAQKAYIEASGEATSQWIREAVQQRIDAEAEEPYITLMKQAVEDDT